VLEFEIRKAIVQFGLRHSVSALASAAFSFSAIYARAARLWAALRTRMNDLARVYGVTPLGV